MKRYYRKMLDRVIGRRRRRLECIVQQQDGHIEHNYDMNLKIAVYCTNLTTEELGIRNNVLW